MVMKSLFSLVFLVSLFSNISFIHANEMVPEEAIQLFKIMDTQFGFNKNPDKETVKLVGGYDQTENEIPKLVLVMVHDLDVSQNGVNQYLYLNFALFTKETGKWKLKAMYTDSVPCESFKRECKFKIVKMTSGKKVVMSESAIEYLGGMEGFLNIVGVIGNKFKRMLKVKVFDKDMNGGHSGVSNLGDLQFNTFSSKYKFIKNEQKEFDDLKILTVGKMPVVGDNISENSKFAHERARNFRTMRFYTILFGRYEIVQNKTRYSKPSKITMLDYENSLDDKLFQLQINQEGNLYTIQGDSNRVILEKKPFSIILKTEEKADIKVYTNKSRLDPVKGRGFKFLTYFLNDYIALETLTPFEPRYRIKLDKEENNYLLTSTEGHDRWTFQIEKKKDFQSIEPSGNAFVATRNIEKLHFANKSGTPTKTELLSEVTENAQDDTIYEIVFLMHIPEKGRQFKVVNILFK